jgi:cysteine-S-conjugate beta-lyase
VDNPLQALSLAELRERRSAKWRRFPPDVLPLWLAEMDVPLAEPVTAALAAAVARGDTGYAHEGRLAGAFARFARRRYGWSPDPARMVLLPDVMQGVRAVVELISRPGDAVLVNPPVYPPFFRFMAMAGRRVVTAPLVRRADGAHEVDLAAVARGMARPDVRAYLLCNPHNPTGTVLRPDELTAIATLADRHDVRLLVDEIHAPLTYPDGRHTPLPTVAGAAARAAVVFVSASKAWNLAGLKAALAVAGGPDGWELLSRLPTELRSGTGLLGVLAGEAAFTEGDDWLDALVAGLDDQRALVAGLLAARLPAARYTPPPATYLAWLDLRPLGWGDDPAVEALRRGVALASGPAFGAPGAGHARLNFATSTEILTEAVGRLATPPS